MININDFNEFYMYNLLEDISSGKLVFTISDRLKKLLSDIKHEIAYAILKLDGDQDNLKKVTLLDYDSDDVTKFRISQSNKVIEKFKIANPELPYDDTFINKYLLNRLKDTSPIWKETSSIIGIGKVINTIFGKGVYKANQPKGEEKPEIPSDISSFIDQIKYYRDKNVPIFKIVEGKDISKYYNHNNYQSNIDRSNLKNSCMSYDTCTPYIEFYVNNPIKLLILMSPAEPDKIKGRAILWNIDEINGESVDRIFMDRIYTAYDYDLYHFISYAEDNNFLYKEKQDMDYDTAICDPDDGSQDYKILTSYDINESDAYPYIDTMKFLKKDNNSVSNDESSGYDYQMESVVGGYTDNYGLNYVYVDDRGEIMCEDDMVYSEEEGKYIDPDTAIYSEYLQRHVSTEYAHKNWEYTSTDEDWIPKTDIVNIEGTNIRISNVGAGESDEYEYSDVFEKWYLTEDLIESEHYGFLPKDKAINVYMNYAKTETQWIPNTDRYANEYFEKNGEYYHITLDKTQI